MKDLAFRFIFLFATSVVLSSVAHAATYTSTAAGAWTTTTNWSPTAPTGGPTGADVVIINHAMTRSGFSNAQWGSSSSITIKSGGSLTISGNTTLTGSGYKITIEAGGTLEITGTFIYNNQAVMNVYGVFKAGAFTVDGSEFNNRAGATTTIASLTTSNNGTTKFYNTGVLNVSGDVTANGTINLYPGSNSTMTVSGTLTIVTNPNMVVGTNVGSCGVPQTQYANLIARTNVVLKDGGDVIVNQNGRFVVFGNITYSGSNGDTRVTVNCGAQAYVHGTINLGTGGGSMVTNSNGAGSPTGTDGNPVIGLYVNGTTTAQTKTGTIGTQAQMLSNDKPFFDYIGAIPGSPLPVKLLFFKVARVNDQGISLAWATSMEKNFSHFEVQRARADLDFQTIGIVQGSGDREIVTQYALLDPAPANGKNYYRLKAIDLDKSVEYFPVIVAEWTSVRGVSLYPNPSTDHTFTLTIGDEFEGAVRLVVYEPRGAAVFATSLDAKQSTVSLPDTVEAGVYVVRITSLSKQATVRLIVN